MAATQIFTVFQAQERGERFFEVEEVRSVEGYVPVGTVKATSLEAAFMQTQHPMQHFTVGPEVERTETCVRSTSVGDIIADEAGAFFAVDRAGFKVVDVNLKAGTITPGEEC